MIEQESHQHSIMLLKLTKSRCENLCRLCLQDGTLKSVFADDENPKLYQKIQECTSVMIEQGDGLPERICEYCISELNLAYYFRSQCKTSDHKLRKIYQQVQMVVTTDHNENNIDVKRVPYASTATKTCQTDIIHVPSPIQTLATEKVAENAIAITSCDKKDVKVSTVPKLSEINESKIVSKTAINTESLFTKITQHVERFKKKTARKSLTNRKNIVKITPTSANVPRIKSDSPELQQPLAKPFQCYVCDKSFTFLSRLRQHEKCHSNLRPYNCAECSKTFGRLDVFKSHQLTHLQLKPFQCDLCHAKFTRNYSLKKHMQAHSDKKMYHCKICEKDFSRPDNFSTHMNIHIGNKKYKCSFCTKSFIRGDVWRRHLLIHETCRVKYNCSQCSGAYSRLDVLKMHLKRKHQTSVAHISKKNLKLEL